eukprot:PhM_4_TR14278/c0_g1_i1/m.4983
MFHRTVSTKYILAFNPAAKARPNFGLKGVGYYSSETYHKAGRNYYSYVFTAIMPITVFSIYQANFFSIVDDLAGGGPVEYDYGFRKEHTKPWDFAFPVGEGYAAGKPTYRKAEGAIEFHH